MAVQVLLAIKGASALAMVPVTKTSGKVHGVGSAVRYDNLSDGKISLPVPASVAAATSPTYKEWKRIDDVNIKFLKSTKELKGEDGTDITESGGSAGGGTAAKITITSNSLPIGVSDYATFLTSLQDYIGSDFIVGIGLGLDSAGDSLGVGYLYATLTNAVELGQSFEGTQTFSLEFTGKELDSDSTGDTAITGLTITSITPQGGEAIAFGSISATDDLKLGKFIFV